MDVLYLRDLAYRIPYTVCVPVHTVWMSVHTVQVYVVPCIHVLSPVRGVFSCCFFVSRSSSVWFPRRIRVLQRFLQLCSSVWSPNMSVHTVQVYVVPCIHVLSPVRGVFSCFLCSAWLLFVSHRLYSVYPLFT